MLDGPGPILEVSDLRTVFATRDGAIHAVNGVSFSIGPGELLGVVGESGSGKSVTMMSLMGLLPSPPAEITGGSIVYQGREVREMSAREMRALRGGGIGFVFQDPMTSLNPVFTIGYQLVEPIRVAHGPVEGRGPRPRGRAPRPRRHSRRQGAGSTTIPTSSPGGMRQRVMIAMALSCDPKLLIADEPTTALDVTIQAQILEIVRELRQRLGMGIIWITHDLGLVAGIADRVMVMYAGQVVEHGPVSAIFADPQHPYTRALLGTVPSVTGPREKRLRTIEGQPPILMAEPRVLSLRAALPACLRPLPPPRIRRGSPVGAGHDVACWWDPATDGPRDV